MNIHEYQAKALFRQFGVPVPQGKATGDLEEVAGIVAELGSSVTVVKAQIHAGGRGKGGGVKVTKSPADALAAAKQILGMQLVTHQTGPTGQLVRHLLIEEGIKIDRELYVAILIDRDKQCPVFILSTEGGMDIEQVARDTPEKIIKEYIHPTLGLQACQARKMAFALGLSGNAFKMACKCFTGLYNLLMEKDCSQVEVNPLVITSDDQAIAADAKINFDDNATFRHPDIEALRDTAEENPMEMEAAESNLNYIKLDGNVGCMVNGAGLAMSTMDVIKLYGAEPANFLDVGGTASVETVSNGFRIILSDPAVKAILINVYGGIVRCDQVALGVIEAAKTMKIKLPVVIRLSGTNSVLGKKILDDAQLNFITATSLVDAAKKVVAAIKEN